MNFRIFILFLIPTLIWGSTWYVIKFQLGLVDPLVSVSWRFLLAGLILMLYCKLRGLNLKFKAKEHRLMLLLGVLPYWVYLSVFGSIIAFSVYLKLLGEIGPDRSVYIALITPAIALLISTLFEGYRWKTAGIAGVLLLMAGNVLALKNKLLIK